MIYYNKQTNKQNPLNKQTRKTYNIWKPESIWTAECNLCRIEDQETDLGTAPVPFFLACSLPSPCAFSLVYNIRIIFNVHINMGLPWGWPNHTVTITPQVRSPWHAAKSAEWNGVVPEESLTLQVEVNQPKPSMCAGMQAMPMSPDLCL